MALQFKDLSKPNIPAKNQQFVPIMGIGQPLGMPIGLPSLPFGINNIPTNTNLPPPQMPGDGLKRAANYYADYAGCGWWRMIAPELLLNIEQKGIINGFTTMITDPSFYGSMSAIRLQRQATPMQLRFIQFLKEQQNHHDFKIIYEIDDIIFKDDIPDFNRCKVAFENKEILESSLEMMRLSDEISVTCQFMKEYYMDKTGNKNITVIPNYPARMWLDNHYNSEKIMTNYSKNKNLPRIAYIGSGTHIDVANKVNQRDDFFHVVNTIIQTRNIFHWVFVGCYPLPCKPFIDRGEMEVIQWFPLKDLHKAYTTTNCQAVFAPLMDCTFNKAKSNIKYLEAATCGIPGVFQNLCTYKDAPLKFTTGSELIDQLKFLLKDEQTYQKYSKMARSYAESNFLDEHLDEFVELYFTKIGTPGRKTLLKLNPEQGGKDINVNPLLERKI